jgi:hypothetical protein
MRQSPSTVTSSDRAYGAAIACLGGVGTYCALFGLTRPTTNSLLVAFAIGILGGAVVAAAVYWWASRAKGRWRRDGLGVSERPRLDPRGR